MPGYLIPSDIWRLSKLVGSDLDYKSIQKKLLIWAVEHVRASPGATVCRFLSTGPVIYQIPTLVPARKADGRTCHWLTKEHKCQVHADAPFGCAFMDSHRDPIEGQNLSLQGLEAISLSILNQGAYGWLWEQLDALGLRAPSAQESRQTLQADLRKRVK
jgi:hypothetical protein